jgi:hypothetical protein
MLLRDRGDLAVGDSHVDLAVHAAARIQHPRIAQ